MPEDRYRRTESQLIARLALVLLVVAALVFFYLLH